MEGRDHAFSRQVKDYQVNDFRKVFFRQGRDYRSVGRDTKRGFGSHVASG
jgi:hypothetical protein